MIAELYVLNHPEASFEFLFVGQSSLSPGLLLAPLSHGSIVGHFSVNMMLLLLVGWSVESHLDSRDFVLFTAFTAYIPTYLQIVHATITTGTAGTLGFSGAVYAFPPVLLCLRLRDTRILKFGDMGILGLSLTIAIPILILDLVGSIVSAPLPAAKVTHFTGYLTGWAYGLLLLKGYFE
jgi:membrane associated rhomboid family serine protease